MTTNEMLTIGHRITQVRERLGLTVDQLADAIERESGMVRKFESGEVVPNVKTLTCIARALDTSIAELYDVDDGNVPGPSEPPRPARWTECG